VIEKRRVLHVLGPSTGGIRRHVAFLSDALRDRGWDVAIAGPAGVMDGIGSLDHVVPIPGGLNMRAIPKARAALRALMPQYDIVHAHGLTAGWLAALARRRRQPPLVVTVHNLVLDDVVGWAAPPLRVLERALPARVDGIIAVSAEIAAHLAGRRRGAPITVVGALGPPPIPARSPEVTRAALGCSPDTPLVVSVARFHRQKGLDVLIAAIPDVLERLPDVRIALVGEGPLEAALRAQVGELGLEAHVIFAAPHNPADELAAASVVTIPSRWESGPLVLAEAMLLGRPVVATPVGTVGDLIEDGVTGWLVPVADRSALGHALIEALVDSEAAARRAAAGEARARALASPSERVSLVEGVYRASLGSR
jgi:glycosyltransferase involved in cell wall biosynthesis